jgi:hypothetical protein
MGETTGLLDLVHQELAEIGLIDTVLELAFVLGAVEMAFRF